MGAQGEPMQALGEYANTTLKVHSRQLDSNIGPSCFYQLALMALEGWAHPWKQKP